MGPFGKLQRPLRFQNHNLFSGLLIIDDFKAIFVGMTHVKVDSLKVTKICFWLKLVIMGMLASYETQNKKIGSKEFQNFLIC